MKKINFLFVLVMMLLISGCNTNNGIQQNKLPEYIPSSADIVDTHGKIKNMNRLEGFLENVEKGVKDSIRIVRFTIEGVPILRDVEFDGTTIKSTIDSRRDQYGSGSVTTTTCTSIEKVETNEGADFILQGCNQQIDNIILSTW